MVKRITTVIIISVFTLPLLFSGCLDFFQEKVHYIYFDGYCNVDNKDDVVVFDANKFIDDISEYSNYTWYFGDGTNASGINITHKYNPEISFPILYISLKLLDNNGMGYLVDCGIVFLYYIGKNMAIADIALPLKQIDKIDGIRLNNSNDLSDTIDWLRVQFSKYGTKNPVDMNLISVHIQYPGKKDFTVNNLKYIQENDYYLHSNSSYFLFNNNYCNNPDFLQFDHLLFPKGWATIYINLTGFNTTLFPNTNINVKIEEKHFSFGEGYTSVKTPDTYNTETITLRDATPSIRK